MYTWLTSNSDSSIIAGVIAAAENIESSTHVIPTMRFLCVIDGESWVSISSCYGNTSTAR